MNRARGLRWTVRAYVSSRCLIKENAGVLNSSRVSSSMSSQLPYSSFSFGESYLPKYNAKTGFRSFARKSQYDPSLGRDFLARLWVADMRMEEEHEKRKLQIGRARKNRCRTGVVENQNSTVGIPFGRWLSGVSSVSQENNYQKKAERPVLKQPPVSQSMTGYLAPDSPEEARIAPLLARSNLLIRRDIEWANLAFGFEQENRYAIIDVCYPHSPVGFIREQSNIIGRQLLRTRRPFVAYITDATGNELFQVRRPFWWITSSIFVEVNGKEVGVVHRRWHLWRRIYDLYLGNKQFAVVENPGFWFWTFTLKDADGNVVAEIDRNWRGIGFELFTDAGQYAIRFGASDHDCSAPGVEDLEVARPLTLSERAVTLALAISLDNDYFSRHGNRGMFPFVIAGE